MKKMKIAVISTGNGGQAMSAYLSQAGYEVALYAREQERVDMFESRRFTLTGIVQCETELALISCDMKKVIEGAELIMVTTPAQYHPVVAREMSPHLADGQTVVLNPGRTLGTNVFAKTLRDCGCKAQIYLAETDTFVFTCRCVKSGHPAIYAIKKNLRAAAHDPQNTPKVVALLRQIFPHVLPAASVLETDFGNIGMVFHPLPLLMNLTRVENREEFYFYTDAISPLVAGILERLDAERVGVAAALGVQVPTAKDWMKLNYGVEGDDLYTCIQNNPAYAGVMGPSDIDSRYIFEDVPTGCVPISCVGKAVGVKTPVIDAAIQWASVLYDRDFYATGRNDHLIDMKELLRSAGR